MKYKNLGKAGVKVSSLCLGTMTFGDVSDEAMSKKVFAACRDAGINFFDCANGYAKGESERILGKLIKPQRDQVVVATKGYYPVNDDINGRGASRFHLTKALEGSLKRLNTDYVDLYYVHHFDDETPLDETLSVLNDFVCQGKVLYLGLSNFSAWQVMKAIGICQREGFAPISCIQPMYSLLKRQCESELLPMAQSESMGVFPYSPLGGGYLTGKYLKKSGSGRFDTSKMYQKRYKDKSYTEIVKDYKEFIDANQYDPVTLAIAWVAAHPAVTAPIIGARNLEQLKPALAVADFQMNSDLREALSALSPKPALPTDRSEEAMG